VYPAALSAPKDVDLIEPWRELTLYIFLIQNTPEFRRDGRHRLVFVAVARRATFRRGVKPKEAGVVSARLSGGIDMTEDPI
jgi:hypothetical protein